MSYISFKKTAKILECNENQLYALVNMHPNVLQHKGMGMNRKFRLEDVNEWRKRKTSFSTMLRQAAQPITPIIFHDKEPQMSKKKSKAGASQAPDTIHTGHGIFTSVGCVARDIDRSYATVLNWVTVSPVHKVHELPNPKVSGSRPYKYITSKAVDFVKQIASERKPFDTKKSRSKVTADDDKKSILKAATELELPQNRIRKYIEDGVIKTYGDGPTLVSVAEVKKYSDKHPITRRGRHSKPQINVEDLQSVSSAAKILGVKVKRMWYVVSAKKALSTFGRDPLRISIKEARSYFAETGELDSDTTAKPQRGPVPAKVVPVEAMRAPATTQTYAGGNGALDREILLKALEHPDADVTNRVLALLERAG